MPRLAAPYGPDPVLPTRSSQQPLGRSPGAPGAESARAVIRLEALLAVADKETSLVITGNGDVIEPEEGLIAIGSGGPYAQSAARALLMHTELSAREIVETSLNIAGDICIYTNRNLTIEELDANT